MNSETRNFAEIKANKLDDEGVSTSTSQEQVKYIVSVRNVGKIMFCGF